MRNELKIIELTEKYLTGQLSASDRAAFEKKLAESPQLQQDVALQKELMAGIERAALSESIQRAHRKYKMGKSGLSWGVGTFLVIVAAAGLIWFAGHSPQQTRPLPGHEAIILSDSTDTIALDHGRFEAGMNLPSQPFPIYNDRDTVIETKAGIVFAIPAGSFLDANGKKVKGAIQLDIREAMDAAAIIQSGLSTTSGDQLLETGGMFYINASQGDQPLQIDSTKGIYAEVPAEKRDPDMMLFEGKRLADGSLDWVKPTPLEQYLTPVDIHSIDYYPPNYLDSLAATGNDATNKRFTDSVYYSFAADFGDRPTKNEASKTETLLSETVSAGQVAIAEVKTDLDRRTDATVVSTPPSKPDRIRGDVSWNSITDTVAPAPRVSWETSAILIADNLYEVVLTATIPPGWRLYSGSVGEAGPTPVRISVAPSLCAAMIGKLNRAGEKNKFDKNFEREVSYFVDKAVFKQQVRARTDNCRISISITSMLGNDMMAYPIQNLNTSVLLNNAEPLVESLDELLDSASGAYPKGINPAKIKAIWNDKFQNTLLATREFEERIPAIHRTCSGAVLDLYVRHSEKRLDEIDALAATLLTGEERATFEAFADQQYGRVKDGNRFASMLRGYYQRKTTAYTKATRKTHERLWKEHQRNNRNAQSEKAKNTRENKQRASRTYTEEFKMNLAKVNEELGIEKTRPAAPPAVYPVRISRIGWKNVDKYTGMALADIMRDPVGNGIVSAENQRINDSIDARRQRSAEAASVKRARKTDVQDATRERKTLDYTHPMTGKQATIAYKEVAIPIADGDDYDQVRVYLLPDRLSSFQRLYERDGAFQGSLNELLSYQLVCVAYKGNQAYYNAVNNLTAAVHNSPLALEPVSKHDLDVQLRQLRSPYRVKSMLAEVHYQRFEQAESVRQNRMRKRLNLRNELRPVVFPCGTYTIVTEDDEEFAESASVDEDLNKIFKIVEEMPEFPGGMTAMQAYMSNNTKYPQSAIDARASGTIYVQFIIEPTGEVTNVELTRANRFNHDCDNEAIRVIQNMPNWIPGEQDGKPVRVQMNTPVKFTLN